MAIVREQFRDPADVLDDYIFDIGHYGEESQEFSRQVTRTAPTTGTGYVRQQGPDSPLVFKYSGTILDQAQFDAMLLYYQACATRTIIYRDFTDAEWEVIITVFDPTRIPLVQNPREPSLLHYWKYRLEMEAIGPAAP